MEADSTTYDNNKAAIDGPCMPFNTCPGNFKLFREFVQNNCEKSIESQIVARLQDNGLIPQSIKCISNTPDCKMVCRTARVVDKLQWICAACRKRQPIREGSFFMRLQCSLPQALQMMLAWCEDADLYVTAEHFGVKTKVAAQIYDRMDDLAIKEYNKILLGGANSVVLAEMFPDCLNRLSPDTTDYPHVHRILMLADTKHIPTYYRLHVLKDDTRKINASSPNQMLKTQIETFIAKSVTPDSTLVAGNTMPSIDGAVSIQQLTQQCDADMQHFLTSSIWKQAINLCTASRDLCANATQPSVCASATLTTICAAAVQRYLNASLYRLRYGDGFFQHMLKLVADEYTTK